MYDATDDERGTGPQPGEGTGGKGNRGEQRHSGTSASLLARFRRQAARTPAATALIVGGVELTYRELDLASAALADRLRRRGAGPGRVVCIRLEQNAVAVTGMLAALRTGAAWAVVEPDQPNARLRALLADTDCAVVMVSGPGPVPAELPKGTTAYDVAGLGIPELVAEGQQLGRGGEPGPGDGDVPETAPAYIVCTSGSTGTPKGVLVSRGQLATSISPRQWVYGAGHSTFLMAMRLSFDGMLGGMFWSFTNGHTLLLPDEKQLRQVHELARLAGEFSATHLIVVPSYYRALLTESRLLPDTLRLVVVAGEPCTQDLVRLHHERLPGTPLANEYGPTETTISCTVQPGVDPSWERVPIGMPWRGAEARVLDERLREVARGERGELYIGGGFVALGYAGQPARTAERFVADPYGPPGARLYRTGDIAHVDASGALHCHGRTDHQVKIRGTRVELGETEAVLETHPRVGQAVVVHDTSGEEPRLVAFLTPATPGDPPPAWAELREHCGEHLVEQAVPVLFHALKRMPRSSSGKADRNALAAMTDQAPASFEAQIPDSFEAQPPGSFVAKVPGSSGQVRHGGHGRPGGHSGHGGHASASGAVAAETAETGETAESADPADHLRTLTEIWAAVLGHGESGPDDNFFSVGGSSLRVIDLHKRLERQWPGVLRVGELFDLTTIAAQAEALTARLGVRARRDEHVPAAYEL